MPFSLRNFIVSLVLMSHCTVEEKLDILYDLFDWNDGVADGLDLNSIFLLIKTIFERNLYYWPSQELYNLIEISFDESVSMVYKAYWSREANINLNKKHMKFQEFLNIDQIKNPLQRSTIDVTEEVQSTLNSYQRMFGNKIIDFNFDSSSFKNIELLIKEGQKLIEMANSQDKNFQFRLILFCQVSGERFTFEISYDSFGQLVKTKESLDRTDMDSYLKRNINKLFLQGRTKGISKVEFMKKTTQIPFLQDLIRIETLYRDRVQNTMKKKQKLKVEVVVLLSMDDYFFVFRFQQKVKQNVEGEVEKLENKVYRVLMQGTFEEDVIADIRQRIISVFEKILKTDSEIKQLDKKVNILTQVGGSRDFETFNVVDKQWVTAQEFQRLVTFQDMIQHDQLVFKFVKTKLRNLDLTEEERDLAAYDCYSLYKHSDQSYEWRLCKIVRKEPIRQAILGVDEKQSQTKFFYWIEFLHFRNMGQELWLKRKRQEILMSTRYAREQQRNFEQEVGKFIRKTYKDGMNELLNQKI